MLWSQDMGTNVDREDGTAALELKSFTVYHIIFTGENLDPLR